jgi:hypothetical protein
VSIFGPKAFSILRAISPERSAFPFKRLERAGRETRKTFAAAVTDKPSGSMISVRINSPGCGGLNIGMASISLGSVIILEVHVADFALGALNPEGHSPIPCNVEAPRPLSLTLQYVRFPDRDQLKFARFPHCLQVDQHLAELVYAGRRYAFGIIILIEAS